MARESKMLFLLNKKINQIANCYNKNMLFNKPTDNNKNWKVNLVSITNKKQTK